MVILLAMIGCKKEMYTPDEPVVDPENVFDFSTREKYTLHVKYDVPENYKVYFEVYTKDPEQLDADGQVVKRDIEPVDVGFTDGNGEYNHKIEVPATAKYLYIYSPYAGVPRVLVAEIKDGVLSEVAYPDEIEGARSMLGRADDGDYKNEAYNTITGKKLSRLGYWKNAKGAYSLKGVTYDLYGRPDYTKVGDRITVSRDILNLINQTVPEGGKVDPSLIRNGDIRVTKKAHIDLFLVDETTSANNTLAYYCYETNNPPKKEADIKVNDIVIAFPNAKVLKRHDYEPKGNNGALERGEGVRLHYYKDGKDMGEEFPEGVEYTYPEGGLFIWVELPKHLDSRIIMKDCLANNVAYVPGGSFFPNGGTENCFRLNYSNMSDDRIVEGIKRIGLVLRKYMAVKQNV